jgi:RNA methyltransferase, TrmH family
MAIKRVRKKEDEEMVMGINAVSAKFTAQRELIVKAKFSESIFKSTEKKFKFVKEMAQYLAKNKKSYEVCGDEELSTWARSVHHEGVAILIKTPKVDLSASAIFQTLKRQKFVMIMEGVTNPHNLGAVVRSLAFLNGEVLAYNSKECQISASAYRVAQGGVDKIIACDYSECGLKQLITFLQQLHFTVWTTEVAPEHSVELTKARLEGKHAFIIGNELTGVSETARSLSNRKIHIGGVKGMDSLNLSVASSLLIYEWTKQNKK